MNNPLVKKYGDGKRWVNWKLVEKEGKETKIPYFSKNKKASSTDPSTWKTSEQAAHDLDNGSNEFSGVGIVLHDSKLLCIDIDHVVLDGKIWHTQSEKILHLLKASETFTEISQSGTGLHLFFELAFEFTPITNKKAPFEIYTNGRYIAVTGNSYHKIVKPLRVVRSEEELLQILNTIGYPWTSTNGTLNLPDNILKVDFSDEDLLKKIFSSKNGPSVKKLYDGNIADNDDDRSKADMALLAHLAFWTSKNKDQMERIWISSPLGQREKTLKRKDYRVRSISNAINNCKEVYKGPQNKEAKVDKEKEDKKKFKTTIVTDEYLYEMVCDKKKKLTSFVQVDRKGNIKTGITEVVIGDEKFLPLPANHDFITKNVVLFPSCASEFNSEKELLEKIQTFIHKYVDISEAYEQISAYYVLFTWLYDHFYEVPYLRVIGDYGSGKTRCIYTNGSISYKPIFTSGATTTSPLFRIIDEMGGTLILDEADFNKSEASTDIIKILNTGYQKGVGVMRSEGKGTFEVKVYNVYGPKIIATRETFTDKALESRCLVEEMGKSTIRKGIPLTTHKNFPDEALELRNQLLTWRLKNYFKDFDIKEEVIEGIHPRLNQIILPLFSIIKDEDVKQKLIDFIKKYNENLTDDRSLSREADIVFHILKLQHEKFNPTELTMKEIADSLNLAQGSDEESITPRKVGWYLRAKLQLKPQKGRRGFTLNLKRSEDRLLFWKERFGITDADIRGEDEDVENVVNNEERSEPTQSSVFS